MKLNSKRILVIAALLEVFVFLLTTLVLAYFSATQEWDKFAYFGIAASVVFVALVVLRSNPEAKLLKRIRDRENKWTSRMESLGLRDLYNMQIPDEQYERNSATREFLSKSSNISLVSASAASYIDPTVSRHWETLKSRLEDGATLRLLVPAPDSPVKAQRDAINAGKEKPDGKYKFDEVIRIHREYTNAEVRLTYDNLYCALLMTDEAIFYDPYHLGKVGDRLENQMICMRIDRSANPVRGVSYARILRSHFENSWNAAKPLDLFLGQDDALTLALPELEMIPETGAD